MGENVKVLSGPESIPDTATSWNVQCNLLPHAYTLSGLVCLFLVSWLVL